MQKILIASLVISLIIVIILFLRERSTRIASEKCNDYYEKERACLKTEIQIKNEKISALSKENIALKKKNGKLFMAEVRYLFIFLSHIRRIRLLSRKNINTFRNYKRKVQFLTKKNEGLNYHLRNYEKIKIQMELQYKNLD